MELPEKALIDKDNPLRQKQLFQLFCEDLPTYQELVSGTANMRFIFTKNCVLGLPQKEGKSQLGRRRRGCSNYFRENKRHHHLHSKYSSPQ